ncbi:MAG: hypothetical protein AAF490_07255 [Chloroflexota bacterium]
MKLICLNCSAKIRPKDINIQKMIAVCEICGHLFQFNDQFEPEESTSSSLSIPQPSQITVHNDIKRLIIEWRWWHIGHNLQIIFTTVIGGWIMIGWIPLVLEALTGDPRSIISTHLLPYTWIVFSIIYSNLALIFNSTTFTVDEFSLKMRHGPIPWFGHRTVKREDIVQIFTKEVPANEGSRSFHLSVILANGKDLKIVSVKSNVSISTYIEQELEAFMGIKNKKVKGEYDPINAPALSYDQLIEEFNEQHQKGKR